ncbi:MAG: Holliday junction branch migration DNA helicase RuvB [Planctomycetota bacterium]
MTGDDVDEPLRHADLNRRSDFDPALRPRSLDEFVGQDRVRQNLRIAIQAASLRGECLEHLLLSGLPGLGKTTLSHIIAAEQGSEMRVTSGPALERTGDLVGILSSLKRGDILFIDEIHRLPRILEEYLYSAMEDLVVDIIIDQGPGARSVRLPLEPFTLIGATTREGLLTAPFRARFGLQEKLELYPASDLCLVLRRTARLLNVQVDEAAFALIAERSRGTPRIANRLLRRVRDLADVRGERRIGLALGDETLDRLGIDEAGLVETDRKILRCLERHGGGPAGIKTLAAAVGESEDTLETVYEPYLLTVGFLSKTPRGRMLTPHGFRHLNAAAPNRPGSADQPGLFP